MLEVTVLPMTSAFFFALLLAGTVVGQIFNPPQSVISFPRSARALRQRFGSGDFVFGLLNRSAETNGLGGTVRPLNVAILPSLQGQGTALTLFDLEPCGINLPHNHQRATEIIFMMRGDSLRTGFVEENGGRAIINDIVAGEVTFFPHGLIHFQQNMGCNNVTFLSALNHEDPGVLTFSFGLFAIPIEGVAATLNQDESLVNEIRQGLPQNPAEGQLECRQRCGIA